MRTLALTAALALAALSVPAVANGHEEVHFGTYIATGVRPGAATNPFVDTFTSVGTWSNVTVAAVDDVTDRVFLTICIDVNQNNVCIASDNDVQGAGYDSVTISPPTGITAGTEVTVFVYTAAYTVSGGPAVATTGVLTATFN